VLGIRGFRGFSTVAQLLIIGLIIWFIRIWNLLCIFTFKPLLVFMEFVWTSRDVTHSFIFLYTLRIAPRETHPWFITCLFLLLFEVVVESRDTRTRIRIYVSQLCHGNRTHSHDDLFIARLKQATMFISCLCFPLPLWIYCKILMMGKLTGNE